MFIENLSSNPHYYVYVVVTLVLSSVLHELAHGWAAIWQGDRTPIDQGHMTIDPRVHMGFLSLLMVLLMGMGFGAMPVNPRRFRSRHGDTLVSLAGPLMNLILAVVALTGLASWQLLSKDSSEVGTMQANLREFLWVFSYINIVLSVFNLIPIPPLDGSNMLANLHLGYARLIGRVNDARVFVFAYLVVVGVLTSKECNIFRFGQWTAELYLRWLYTLFA